MRRRALLVPVAIVLSLAVGSVALAAPADTDTTFKMEDKGDFVKYSGRISSDKPGCIRNRTVKIFHKGFKIAETKSDDEGKWSVNGPKPPDGDDVTAEVKKRRRHGKTICRRAEVTKEFHAGS